MPIRDVVILGAARTPIGRFGGSFKDLHAAELGAVAARAAIARAGIATADVDEVLIGHGRPAGVGPNPARQVAHRTGIPDSVAGLHHQQGVRGRHAGARLGRAKHHARRIRHGAGRRHREHEPRAVSDRRRRCALGPQDGPLPVRRRDVSRRVCGSAVRFDHGRDGGSPGAAVRHHARAVGPVCARQPAQGRSRDEGRSLRA